MQFGCTGPSELQRKRGVGFGAGSVEPIGDAVGMTDTTERPSSTSSDVVDEVRAWLEENWDPDLTVAQWWERLGLAGWSAPTLPENAYGRGLSRNDAVLVQNTAWTNVEKAIANLKAGRLLSLKTLHQISHEELAALIDKYAME